jgi:hypothetical protein
MRWKPFGSTWRRKRRHELGNRHPHDFALVTATLPVVLPAEVDVGLIEIEWATVGDSDPMGVARETTLPQLKGARRRR